eukprot:GHVR01128018.1.p1 GENE.GHVR01128018.1~~GHVR01128018.1.p1  ORF type:complete len:422 (+),score=138.63 GHVR01128018.1:106-1371(+)
MEESEEEMMRVMMGFSSFGTDTINRNTDTNKDNKLVKSNVRVSNDKEKHKYSTEYIKEENNKTNDVNININNINNNDNNDNNISSYTLPFNETVFDPPPNVDGVNDIEYQTFDNNDEDIYYIPRRFNVSIAAHRKALTSLAVNPKCSRMASGGFDHTVKLWDFNGMTSDKRSFRSFEPIEGHAIQGLCFNSSGSHFICAAGECNLKIYTQDGEIESETIKGDMYIRDMTHTRGHTHMICCCDTHPLDRECCLTGSYDGTIRIWDIFNSKVEGVDKQIPNKHCFKIIDKRGINICNCHVLSAVYRPDGKIIVAGCNDGSIQLFNEKRFSNKPEKVIRGEIGHSTDVVAVKFSCDANYLISRDTNTVKLWDMRQLKTPLVTRAGLPHGVHKSSVGFSPCNKMIYVACGSINTHTHTHTHTHTY